MFELTVLTKVLLLQNFHLFVFPTNKIVLAFHLFSIGTLSTLNCHSVKYFFYYDI